MARVKYLSIPEAAEHIGLSVQRTHVLIKDGKLPSVTTWGGRTTLVRLSDAEKFAAREREPGRPRG